MAALELLAGWAWDFVHSMSWLYQQINGFMLVDGALVGVGYSGHPPHVNDPAAQNLHDIGPIPVGTYLITAPHDSSHGPYTLGLTPDPTNDMHGRSAFLIHGDRVDAPGMKLASLGCIILSRDVRRAIWESGDRVLQVISGQ